MKRIELSELRASLKPFENRQVFFHVEVTPGAFVRNMHGYVEQVHAAGNGPYRVGIKLKEDSWIRVEGLTDQTVDEEGRLLLAGHDDIGRLTVALELSLRPFPA
jgi:hypothetical protein